MVMYALLRRTERDRQRRGDRQDCWYLPRRNERYDSIWAESFRKVASARNGGPEARTL